MITRQDYSTALLTICTGESVFQSPLLLITFMAVLAVPAHYTPSPNHCLFRCEGPLALFPPLLNISIVLSYIARFFPTGLRSTDGSDPPRPPLGRPPAYHRLTSETTHPPSIPVQKTRTNRPAMSIGVAPPALAATRAIGHEDRGSKYPGATTGYIHPAGGSWPAQ